MGSVLYMKNNKPESNQVFNLIAPIYGLFYKKQKRIYEKNINNLLNECDIKNNHKIIDFGCGTGALCSVLHQKGFEVIGVDSAQKMLNIAMNKLENKSIKFINASVIDRLPFEDKTFDISFASFVVHGLKKVDRIHIYSEMSRITKHKVVIYDYNDKRAIVTNVLEWLEGGDYFNFIKTVELEMKEYFQDCQIISNKSQASWYVCTPRNE